MNIWKIQMIKMIKLFRGYSSYPICFQRRRFNEIIRKMGTCNGLSLERINSQYIH